MRLLKFAFFTLCIACGLSIAVGCNKAADPNDKEQVKQAHDLNTQNFDKAITTLQTANVPFLVELESSGKPALFQHLDIGINTGVKGRVLAWGNFGNSAIGAAAPPPVTAETIATAIVMALQQAEENRRPELPITVDDIGVNAKSTKPKEPDAVTVKTMIEQDKKTPAGAAPPAVTVQPAQSQADSVNHPDSQGLNPESHDGDGSGGE